LESDGETMNDEIKKILTVANKLCARHEFLKEPNTPIGNYGQDTELFKLLEELQQHLGHFVISEIKSA
jgi:hypothetical protein